MGVMVDTQNSPPKAVLSMLRLSRSGVPLAHRVMLD